MKIEYNDELNPKLWKNEKLKGHVRAKILYCAQDFLRAANVSEENTVDIILTGSNAHYHYSEKSDIDIHNVIMPHKHGIYSDMELYKEYITEIKKSRQHNFVDGIKIDYTNVLTKKKTLKWARNENQGNFSVLKNKWNQKPIKSESYNLDKVENEKAMELLNHLEIYLFDGKNIEAEKCLRELEFMRTDSMRKGGEYCTINMIYRELKSTGKLTEINKKLGNYNATGR